MRYCYFCKADLDEPNAFDVEVLNQRRNAYRVSCNGCMKKTVQADSYKEAEFLYRERWATEPLPFHSAMEANHHCAVCGSDLERTVEFHADAVSGRCATCRDCYDGAPDSGHYVGHGRTEQEAFDNLVEFQGAEVGA